MVVVLRQMRGTLSISAGGISLQTIGENITLDGNIGELDKVE